MGSGCGDLNWFANVVRVLASKKLSHFAVEKAPKKIMSQIIVVKCSQSSKKLRYMIVNIKPITEHTY